jgi:ribosomal protein S27AE
MNKLCPNCFHMLIHVHEHEWLCSRCDYKREHKPFKSEKIYKT